MAGALDKAVSEKKDSAEVKLDCEKHTMRKVIGILTARFDKLTIIAVGRSGEVLASRGKNSSAGAIDVLNKRFGKKLKGGGGRDYAEGRIEQ